MKHSLKHALLIVLTLLALTLGALGVSPAMAAGTPPDSTADVVYGQGGSFTSNANIDASSLHNSNGVAIDGSGNLYVADYDNNRVLYYPAGSTTATRVYGQGGDFTTNTENKGGVSADTLAYPVDVAVDGSGNLYVVDQNNHRVLYYPSGSTTATRVYGQGGDFTTNTENKGGVSADSLSWPFGVAVDGSGNLYVDDYYNQRVLYYPSGSTTATRVYGQGGDFTTNAANKGGISAATLYYPEGIAVDGSGNLYVADNTNQRVLFYKAGDASPTTADRVYGQGGSFTSHNPNNGGISADSVYFPSKVALDSNGNLYVADTNNSRVLYYAAGDANPTTADRVYGQGGDFTTGTQNQGGISADSLSYPYGVAVDGSGNLYVAEPANNRVLAYPAGGTTATAVYGQGGDFTTNRYYLMDASHLNSPSGIAVDGGNNLYVADTDNKRVLYYPSGSATPTHVYGQGGDFTTNTDNKGGVSADSLSWPSGVAVDSGGNLYVADSNNNRVLYYPSGNTTATRVYGQGGDFTTNTENMGGVSANSLSYPSGVAVDGSGNLYVADSNNNRVLYYPSGSTTATRVYGQGGSFTTNTENKGGISANSLSNPYGVAVDGSGNLYVADYYNERVLYYPAGTTTATRVYGQGGDFTTNTENKGGISADSFSSPDGVAVDSSGNLYVADGNNNRMLYYPSGSTTATAVYGQDGNFTTNTDNKGGISADSLLYPYGVAVNHRALYVADRDNGRVLRYDIPDTTAPTVLSVTRVATDPTSKKSVAYTVTFSEIVTGVDKTDFALTQTGVITGYSVTDVSGADDVYTVTVDTGSGNGTLRLDVLNDGSILDTLGNPLAAGFTTGQAYTVTKSLTAVSQSANDGWILETGENTNLGGTLKATATTFILGDDAAKKQYRSLLSFSTAALPDTAVITKVTLKIMKQGITGGGNPVTTFKGFMVDIKKGFFGSTAKLQAGDFQVAGSKTVGPLKAAPASNWYSLNLTSAQAFVNNLATNGGLTQIRLRFKLDDNNNAMANYLSCYSGNAPAANRPQLIIEYYVP
jgi:sugar lactone lactonase YvrE